MEVSLQAAVVLANSGLEPETISTVEELSDFFLTYAYTGRHDADAAERDDAVAMVNQMLAEERAVPRLERHDEFDWHLHAVPSDATWAARIRVETAMSMIDVIRADEMSRLGVCADDDCEGVVLDLSRNRSRRFCSTACGNRNAVAAYRARQAAG